MRVSVGDRIRELREANGLSQYKLAQMTGINRSTIKRYEDNFIEARLGNLCLFFPIISASIIPMFIKQTLLSLI